VHGSHISGVVDDKVGVLGQPDIEAAKIDMRGVAGVCYDCKLAEIDRKVAEVLRVASGRELSQRRVGMA
jgi:hypothetical protein